MDVSAWFTFSDAGRFVVFGPSHWMGIACIAVGALALWLWRGLRRLPDKKPAQDRALRYGLAATLVVCEISLLVWYGLSGEGDLRYSLPLQLCDVSVILGAPMLILASRRLYEIVYFSGLAGATIALLTPELWYDFPHFRFWNYFVIHAAIIYAPLYLSLAHGFRPTWRSLLIFMIFINIYGVFLLIVNAALDANYMFISQDTLNPTPVNALGPWPQRLIWMELATLIACTALAAPFALGRGGKAESLEAERP